MTDPQPDKPAIPRRPSGRPRKPPEDHAVRRNISMPASAWHDLDNLVARLSARSRSEVIRILIRRYRRAVHRK